MIKKQIKDQRLFLVTIKNKEAKREERVKKKRRMKKISALYGYLHTKQVNPEKFGFSAKFASCGLMRNVLLGYLLIFAITVIQILNNSYKDQKFNFYSDSKYYLIVFKAILFHLFQRNVDFFIL